MVGESIIRGEACKFNPCR